MVFRDRDYGPEIPQVVDIKKYLPPVELLAENSERGRVGNYWREKLGGDVPGSSYVLIYSHLLGQLIMVPPHHPLNFEPKESPGIDYAQVVFEGLSIEPGTATEANLVLWEPRIERLRKSVSYHGFELPVPLDEFTQGIKDLVSVAGPDFLQLETDHPARAYIRPVVRRGSGPYAISPTPGSDVDMTVLNWNWPYYLDKEDYQVGAPVVALLDAQRREPIRAKEAGNYKRGKVLKDRARKLGGHEVLFLAPYLNGGEEGLIPISDLDVISPEELADRAYLADGMGEEIGMIKDDTLIYPPKWVNRLGGTTLDYCVRYLAPKFGIQTEERLFGFNDLEEPGTSLLMFANAAKVAPVKMIVVASSLNRVIRKINMEINSVARFMVDRFQDELSGKAEPSNKSLLTSVRFDPIARAILDSEFRGWL